MLYSDDSRNDNGVLAKTILGVNVHRIGIKINNTKTGDTPNVLKKSHFNLVVVGG